MDSTFVRKDFYVTPPAADASPEEWEQWIKRDDRKARAHKAAYTKSFEQLEAPESLQSVTRKIGGVHRQVSPIAFVGGEEGSHDTDLFVEAQQDTHIALIGMEQNRNRRGPGSRKGKSSRRHRNKKKRK